MSSKTRLSVLLLSTPLLAFVLVGGLMSGGQAQTRTPGPYPHLRVFDDVVSLMIENYVGDVNIDSAMEGAMRGLADGLDPDSAYLNAAQVTAVESGDKLPEGDVGIDLTRRYYLHVVAARDGSPAQKAGLRTADTVRAIDGKSTRDMSAFEGTRALRGKAGTTVTLTIIRGNAADPHEVALVREPIAGPLVSGRLINAAGYVRIASFRDGVAEQVRKQIGDLTKAGAKSLIVDVRHTAEGSYDNGLATARLFVKSGPLAVKAGREKTAAEGEAAPSPAAPASRETISAQAGDGAITLPVAVLVTTGTAGPGEVFAAAIDGNERGELIGERTLGRAGLQKLVKLPEGKGLWLTYARYLTPKGNPIHGRGLEPDLVVDEPDVEFGSTPTADPILDAAVERTKVKIAA